MFIYSFKASTLKFIGVIGICVVVLIALVFLVPTYSKETTAESALMNEKISFNNVKSSNDGKAFLSQDGWQGDEMIIEECEVTIPKECDKVMTSYNEIQKQQGLDLSKYAKKSAKRYTYKITNYPDYNGTVYANVIVYRDKVISGDICSADAKGFIHTLPMPSSK